MNNFAFKFNINKILKNQLCMYLIFLAVLLAHLFTERCLKWHTLNDVMQKHLGSRFRSIFRSVELTDFMEFKN